MGFNRFYTRLLLSALMASPSYALLFIIRGFDFAGMTAYAYITYAGVVFLILVCLFEIHNLKSRWIERMIPWKTDSVLRLITELFSIILITVPIVTGGMLILYDGLWEMDIWGAPLMMYTIFSLPISILIAVFVNADTLIQDWKQSILRTEMLEKQALMAQFNALQLQLSPHFLFNNFNVLHALIDEDPKQATSYLQSMSEVFRYILRKQENEMVPLADELRFARHYIFMLGIRFGENLRTKIDIVLDPPVFIPPATLQILIENAIMHNEISSDHPLTLQLNRLGSDYLEVSNTLQPKIVRHTGASVGLKNITDRYSFLTDRNIVIEKTTSSFVVRVPLLEGLT